MTESAGAYPHELRACPQCGEPIPRRLGTGSNKNRLESWYDYHKGKPRKFCGKKCVMASARANRSQKIKDEKQEAEDAARAESNKIILKRLGQDWIDWGRRIEKERGFDPLGFYRLAHAGAFEVDFQTSSGEGLLGIQNFYPRESQDSWYMRILYWRRAATDPKFRPVFDKAYPQFAGKRLGRFNKLIVKSRRFGFTTGHGIACLGDAQANRGFGTIVTCYSPDGLTLLSEIFRTALHREKGGDNKDSAKGMAVTRYETSTNSVISLKGPKDDFARGGGFFHLLVSEADYIVDIDSALDSGLPSIGKSPFSMITIESTMRAGATTGYKDFVRRSLRGETAYEVVFLGWMQDDTAVLEPTDEDRARFKNAKRMTATSDVDLYIIKLKELGCTLKQFAWWWQRFQEDARGKLPKMIEAYPTTIEEALDAAEGDDWATTEALEYLHRQCRPPVGRYLMNCKSDTPMRKLPGDVDWARTPHMELWWPSDSESDYAIICDTATGKRHGGENFAVVLDTTQGIVPAIFHARCSVTEFTNAVYQMGVYFGWALICVENNKDGGMIEGLNIRLKYPLSKLYHMEDFHRDVPDDQASIGFTMTQWSRGMAMDRLQMVVNEMRLICPSQILYDQIKLTADRKGIAPSSSEKMKNPDDGAICLAIGSTIRDFSSKWPSRSVSDALAQLMKTQEIVDIDLRESVNTWTPERYRQIADRQRVHEALRRSRGG